MKKERVACPYCGTVILTPEGWGKKEALQNHFDTKFEIIHDLGRSSTPFREANPCYGKKLFEKDLT